MAGLAGGQPPPEAVIPPEALTTSGAGSKLSYAALLQPQTTKRILLPLKNITYLHEEPRLVWEEEEEDEVTQMIVNEHLKYAIIGKFSYRWPDIHDLRRLIP